ncbi:hypothetical protein PSE10A_19210 [Pseudomonas amygdali pv. eriobotryae]|uniref:Uncharacterized protein n=1 Tax=Pseudomonas amygdali pv. eriobotryae TaxID=129137 RepID=A0A9P3ACQ7_PSEA0|nr:hypothetical protein [Pseudomonas amygdali]GFZ59410.1 hypothetical protein PSE10A_19210 [Pseudomonas amygdali pv. eriobotryae]
MNSLNIYLQSIKNIYRLPAYSPALIAEFLKLVDSQGIIELTKWRKETIAARIGINVNTINNALQMYKSKKIVTWEAVSVFSLNKKLFGVAFNNLYDDENGFPELKITYEIIIIDGNLEDKATIEVKGVK